MVIKIKDIVYAIESFAPLYYQESYDNAGVQIGDVQNELTGVLLTLDITPEVLQEAIDLGYNFIVAHHPLIFSGLKRITGKTDIEQCIITAIKHNIILYAAHTNLDNVANGVNAVLANKLNLSNASILSPSNYHSLCKFECYVPEEYIAQVKEALFAAGAGAIGNYSECSFSSIGTGTFMPNNLAQPKIGQQNIRASVNELKVEVLAPEYLVGKLLQAVRNVGFYEEVAYNVVKLENKNQYLGAGLLGQLPQAMTEQEFLAYLKECLQLNVIKFTPLKHTTQITKVAVCGGSGSFLLAAAKAQGADVLVTADYKYHQFFDAAGKIMIADIGHYESEQYTYELFMQIISKKYPLVKVKNTSVNTNPVAYF